MYRQKFATVAAVALAIVVGVQSNALAVGKIKNKKTFRVTIENISSADGVSADGGAKYPFAQRQVKVDAVPPPVERT